AALADELYLQLDGVKIEFSPFHPAYRDPVYNWMFTGNSQSTSSFYDIMRRMGAAAREMLISAAASRWGAAAADIKIDNGRLLHPDGRRSLTYGQVADDAARLPVPEKPTLRPQAPSAGRALRRWDIPAKVDGRAEFGIDVKLPQMLTAAVRCAPRFGARLTSYNAGSVKSKPGVVAAVEVPGGLAVVAKTYWQARRALDHAQLVWSEEGSEFTSTDALAGIYSERLATGPYFIHRSSTPAGGVIVGAADLEATYQLPFQAHATMEPMNCTAWIS